MKDKYGIVGEDLEISRQESDVSLFDATKVESTPKTKDSSLSLQISISKGINSEFKQALLESIHGFGRLTRA